MKGRVILSLTLWSTVSTNKIIAVSIYNAFLYLWYLISITEFLSKNTDSIIRVRTQLEIKQSKNARMISKVKNEKYLYQFTFWVIWNFYFHFSSKYPSETVVSYNEQYSSHLTAKETEAHRRRKLYRDHPETESDSTMKVLLCFIAKVFVYSYNSSNFSYILSWPALF